MADLSLYKSVVDAFYMLSKDRVPPVPIINDDNKIDDQQMNHETSLLKVKKDSNNPHQNEWSIQIDDLDAIPEEKPKQNRYKAHQQQISISSRSQISQRHLDKQPSLNRVISRCSTALSLFDIDMDTHIDTDHDQELWEYGFGTPFSYWKEYKYYPYVAPKYDNLKDELLNNEIQTVLQNGWTEIYMKAGQQLAIIENILGPKNGGDRNTPWAHNDKQWNKIMNIEAGTKISLQHLLSILFYTDLNDLQLRMKSVCRKMSKEETKDDIKKRHCNFAIWLRLLFETILLYGNRLSSNDDLQLYHGLDKKFYFSAFKAKFFIPTSTTSERACAINFASENGIALEFGGIESIGDPYFQTCSLSQYPDEKEFVFFFAELPIKNIYMKQSKFDMSSLSLYQSIVNGNIIIDKVLEKKYKKTQKTLKKLLEEIEVDDDETKSEDEVQQYGYELLKRFIEKTDKVWINAESMISNVGMKPLRALFIEENKKVFKGYSEKLLKLQDEGKIQIDRVTNFKWKVEEQEVNDFLNEDKPSVSKVFKCSNKARFYCQLSKKSVPDTGRISLILHRLPKAMNGQIKVSFDVYCKNMNDFYCRFHDITLKIANSENDRDSHQSIDFKLDFLKASKIMKKKKPMDWQISVRCHALSTC